MSRKTRNFLNNLAYNLFVCIIAGNLFVLFRFYGTLDYENPATAITGTHLWESFIIGIVVSIVNGISITLIDLLADADKFKSRSFRYTIIFKSVAYFVSIIVCIVILFAVYEHMTKDSNILLIIPQELGRTLTGQYIIVLFVFLMLVNITLNFLKEVRKKFGPGITWKLFSGKYHQPKIEDRVFMFLDLKSSTSIAEKLGHIKYSQFIQDCFYEVTEVIDKCRAEVYQYVGDEIVLTWEIEKGIDKENCFRFYFEFRKKLESNMDYYMNKYNVMPEFKAGLHCGTITVTEIGEIKKDIAYHGDVLNTASRIQGLCNTYNKEVLISNIMNNKMPKVKMFKRELIGEIFLKGKETSVGVYSLEMTA